MPYLGRHPWARTWMVVAQDVAAVAGWEAPAAQDVAADAG